MKYTPISAEVPGSGGNELWLTPTEAKLLVKRLQDELDEYNHIRINYGQREARQRMVVRHEKRRRR